MGKINCRGHEKRVAICELYDIKPEFRIKQLSGITISDAGGRITDELYIFSAYRKNDGTFYDKIICGEPTAKDFLSITGKERPPLFNMLKSTGRPSKEKSRDEKKETRQTESSVQPLYSKEDFSDWHPVNKALYDAIMILIVVWGDTDVNGDSVLFKQRDKCVKYKTFYPYSDRLMAVNTMIGKSRQRTLAGILEFLKKKGNNIKDFNLELLHEAVLKCGVKSNII